MLCPGHSQNLWQSLKSHWFPYQVPHHKHRSKCWATSLKATNFLTKMPTTGGFTIILYRMNMTPTCYLTGWLQSAKKPQWPHSKFSVNQPLQEIINCSPRLMLSLPFPKSPLLQISLTKALFFTGEQKLVSWHIALKKLYFSSTVATFQFHFNHDIGIYFSILTAMGKCYCQQYFMTILVYSGQWT